MPIKRAGIQFHKISEGQYIAVHFSSATSYVVHKTAKRRWEIFPLLVDGAKYRGDHSRLHTGEEDRFDSWGDYQRNTGFMSGRKVEYRPHASDEDGKPKVKKHAKHSGFRSAVSVGGLEEARDWISEQHALQALQILGGFGARCTVSLIHSSDRKIQLIKVIRRITGLGLREAKNFVDDASPSNPQVIKENITQGEAEDIQVKVSEAHGVAKYE